MLQRIQTIWLLLAAACGFSMYKVSIFEATLANNVIYKLSATESLLLFAVLMSVACLSLIAIFLFKNRPLQSKIVIISILLSIGAIALEVWQIQNYKSANPITKGTYEFGGLLPIVITIFLILAARGIRKDEKLVKSLDRLR
jgi:peptidoglycan/LPS O-acetylase OafA/YrhL